MKVKSRRQYHASRREKNITMYFSILILVLPILFFVSISLGPVKIPISDMVSVLIGFENINEQSTQIIKEIRLPRAVLAILVGATLAICGAASQGLFRNPLADPSLTGVTAGASLGGAFIFFASANFVGLYSFSMFSLVSFGAFIGGMISAWLVYRFSTSPFGTSVATMLLIGIGLGALTSSAIGFIQFFSSDTVFRQISLWQMGGLQGANFFQVIMAGVILSIIVKIIYSNGTALNVFLLGESEARYLGINIDGVKRTLLICIALGMGICVALSGVIAFVGLVVPHICRLLIGPDHKKLIPLSGLMGACLLLVSDIFARFLFAPAEIPIGLITAAFGAPIFIFLLMRGGFNSNQREVGLN